MSLPEPSAEELGAEIRRIAVNEPDQIRWTKHARQRLEERGIARTAALRVLTVGSVEQGVSPSKKGLGWETKMVGKMVGSTRDVGVVVALLVQGVLTVITVQWEDL